MAFRLGEYVVYGELYNRNNYSTHGIIALRGASPGEETVIRLDLTGNCGPDLRGKGFRFTPDESIEYQPVFPAEDYPKLQTLQIGPTGEMTAQGWVKAFSCSVEEYVQRARLGEPPPTQWKRHLYLEWYSQNGRVLVEMAGARVEQCVRPSSGDDDQGDWVELPNLGLMPESVDGLPAAGPSVTVVGLDDDDVAHVERLIPDTEGNQEDGGTIPDDLQRALDHEARQIDRALGGECEDDAFMREMELADYCMDHCEALPIPALLDLNSVPADDDLDDAAIESCLKSLLMQLAMVGIALDVCKHFSPRDCYRLLRDKILTEERAYKEMVGTGWVQHFSTWEYCPACEAEIQAECERDSREQ